MAKLSILTILALSALALLTACCGATGGGDTSRTLDAAGRAGGGVLTITNRDARAWTNVRVIVNGDYNCPTVERIGPGQEHSYTLNACTKRDGERFNPLTHQVMRVSILASEGSTGLRWSQ